MDPLARRFVMLAAGAGVAFAVLVLLYATEVIGLVVFLVLMAVVLAAETVVLLRVVTGRSRSTRSDG